MKRNISSPVKLLTVLLFLSAPAAFAQGAAYAKVEASFNITGISTDPAVLFDYAQTDVKVNILEPDAGAISLPAFYDGGTTWRVRHTPMMPGTYQITGITLNGSPIAVSNLTPTNWIVTGFPTRPGYVLIDPSNPRRFITSNGRRFYPVGENVAWDNGTSTVTAIFRKMGASHLNWARVWMNHWDGKNLDWNNNGTSPGALGVLNLTVAQKWDSIVNTAEVANVFFQMTLQHHGQYSTATDPNWDINPYNVANAASSIGFLTDPVQFFTNATAKAVTKLKLRYIIARWGYSPSIMAWELFNEVQFTSAAQSGQWNLVQAWHNEMAQFLRSQDPYQHLITTSSDLSRPIWDETDYYQQHLYPADLIVGARDAQHIGPAQPVAPNFLGEIGVNASADNIGVGPPVWGGIMSGQSGAAMPWYWDSEIDRNNDYISIQAAADFVARSGLGDQDVLNKSAPYTTGGNLGSLAFAPSGGWGPNQGPDVFTVVSTAPEGIGLSTSYLQGNYNRSLLTNGYTFNVNYPAAGTFQVNIQQIAASGGTLRIRVDGGVVTNRAWAATGSDVSTNVNTRINVTSGAHTIKIENPGNDWLRLGNITLNPYAYQLAGYAVGNTNFTAMWLWHRDNVFDTTPTPAITGTVDVSGLAAGTYSATWWNTTNSTAISNFTFTVPSPGATVTLATPSVLRSVALFAGLPAAAGVIAPDLSQSAVSGTPLFSVPLTITNSGGLPLAYSLSVTGANTGWLSLSSTNGDAPKLGATVVQVGFNAAGLSNGTYEATLFVNTSDALNPVFVLPVTFTIGVPAAPVLFALWASPSQFAFQIQGDPGVPYVVQNSSNLASWTSVSTNTLPGGVLNLTNAISPGSAYQFWRALWQP